MPGGSSGPDREETGQAAGVDSLAPADGRRRPHVCTAWVVVLPLQAPVWVERVNGGRVVGSEVDRPVPPDREGGGPCPMVSLPLECSVRPESQHDAVRGAAGAERLP